MKEFLGDNYESIFNENYYLRIQFYERYNFCLHEDNELAQLIKNVQILLQIGLSHDLRYSFF